MVAAISTTPRIPKSPSTPQRPPLSPAEKSNNNNNNADSISRKPRSKEITSRYLHSSSSSSSSSSTPSLPSRSQSANRARPRTPTAESPRPLSSTTTRSLSVSFQGASFSFQTTKPKPISQTPKRPRNAAPALAAKTRHANSLTKSLDCSQEKKGPILAAVRVLGHSVVFDEKVKRASFDGEDLYLASDSDSSNSGSQEGNSSVKGRAMARGISVPARFWPESFIPPKNLASVDAQLVSPRMGSSIRLCSPSNATGFSVKGIASPSKVQPSNVPSILSFAAEPRRVKKGENRIEEAHSLRLLYNRCLQWRCVNAQAEAAFSVQMVNAEKSLYNAWLTTSELRDSVTNKRIKLQLLLQNLKIASILKGQMSYVEEWSLVDREHYNYLSGLIEALKASTLRLPVVSGARVDIHELQNAVGSAVDVMQAMGASICSLLSKVERPSALMSELATAAAHEQALLDQSRDLLSTVATMHVKQCSLQGHILQLNRNASLVQL